MDRYDTAVESLLSSVQRSRPRGSGRPIHPIVVFSKFDSVNPKVLHEANLAAAPPDVKKTGPRGAYAEALLESSLPRTIERIRARDRDASPFAKPSYFFSSVRTEAATANRGAKIRLRRTNGAGWEPDYSADEYLVLLERLWKIASDATA